MEPVELYKKDCPDPIINVEFEFTVIPAEFIKLTVEVNVQTEFLKMIK
jgi:hypothetical protein